MNKHLSENVKINLFYCLVQKLCTLSLRNDVQYIRILFSIYFVFPYGFSDMVLCSHHLKVFVGLNTSHMTSQQNMLMVQFKLFYELYTVSTVRTFHSIDSKQFFHKLLTCLIYKLTYNVQLTFCFQSRSSSIFPWVGCGRRTF